MSQPIRCCACKSDQTLQVSGFVVCRRCHSRNAIVHARLLSEYDSMILAEYKRAKRVEELAALAVKAAMISALVGCVFGSW